MTNILGPEKRRRRSVQEKHQRASVYETSTLMSVLLTHPSSLSAHSCIITLRSSDKLHGCMCDEHCWYQRAQVGP